MRSLTLASLALFAPVASAGTFTVAPNPGPGVDFTSVQAAVDAAVEGDTILIETGVYFGQVVIDSKSLTLQGLGSVTLANPPTLGQAGGQLVVQNLAAHQAVDVRSIVTFRDGFVVGPGIEFLNNAGRIWFEEGGTLNSGGRGLVIENSANVMLSELDCRSTRAVDIGGVMTPREGLYIDSDGHVGVVESSFFGSGLPPFAVLNVPTAGGAAVHVERGDLALHGATLWGGNGSSAFWGGCEFGAEGGAGLSLNPDPLAPVLVRERGSSINAGLAGSFYPTCAPEPPHVPAVVDPNGLVVHEPGSLRTLTVPSAAASGQTFDVVFQGEALDFVAVFVGPPVVGQALGGFFGDLWLDPSGAQLMATGQAGAVGDWSRQFTAPVAGLPIDAYAQAFAVAASGEWWLSTPASILIH